MNIVSGSTDPYDDVPPPEDEPSTGAVVGRIHLRDRLLSLSDLCDLAPVRPLVDGLLYRDTLAQLSGPPGSYKSFLALALACSVAIGENFEDHSVPEAGVVVYVAAEGASGMRARTLAWCELAGVDPARLEGRLHFLPEPVQLGDVVDVGEAVEMVREIDATLLVLDTRARCTLGLEENSATEQGKAVHAAETIQRAAGCCVFNVHHSSRAGTAGRGSNAWDGAVWSDLRITGAELSAKVHCEKHKDVAAGCDHEFRLVPYTVSEQAMPDCDEKQRSTLVIVRKDLRTLADETTTGVRAVLMIIRTAAGQEGLSRSVIRDLAVDAGHSRTTAYEAVSVLVSKGLLVNVGTEKTPSYVPSGSAQTS